MCIEHMFINIKIRGRENLIFPQLQWKTTYFFIDIWELFSSNSWKLVKKMMMMHYYQLLHKIRGSLHRSHHPHPNWLILQRLQFYSRNHPHPHLGPRFHKQWTEVNLFVNLLHQRIYNHFWTLNNYPNVPLLHEWSSRWIFWQSRWIAEHMQQPLQVLL